MGATGDEVMARYSFVYVYEDGQWKIAHHHSSVMPEALLAKASGEVLADGEVRALFKVRTICQEIAVCPMRLLFIHISHLCRLLCVALE
jgi:SnoaL-like domain